MSHGRYSFSGITTKAKADSIFDCSPGGTDLKITRWGKSMEIKKNVGVGY